MLLSRALNRGYGMSRFDWPVHFGLLNQDCHWIVDEVQLMGPGLWTTAQLDWMRQKRFPGLKPCRTTWMSATMGLQFLLTTDRRRDVTTTSSLLILNWNATQMKNSNGGGLHAGRLRRFNRKVARRRSHWSSKLHQTQPRVMRLVP
jgi:hypothetical protein